MQRAAEDLERALLRSPALGRHGLPVGKGQELAWGEGEIETGMGMGVNEGKDGDRVGQLDGHEDGLKVGAGARARLGSRSVEGNGKGTESDLWGLQ